MHRGSGAFFLISDLILQNIIFFRLDGVDSIYGFDLLSLFWFLHGQFCFQCLGLFDDLRTFEGGQERIVGGLK
jgi:hypothetical protein